MAHADDGAWSTRGSSGPALVGWIEVVPLIALGAFVVASKQRAAVGSGWTPWIAGTLGVGAMGWGAARVSSAAVIRQDEERRRLGEGQLLEETARVKGIPLDKLVYLAPIALAPVAHNLVTLGASKKTFASGKPFLVAAGATTLAAIAQRLFLMEDAGIDSGRKIWSARDYKP